MKQIFLILLSINLFADHLIFKGTYQTDSRKKKIDGVMGSPGGCIYSGMSNGGRKIKVYTKDSCPIITGPVIGLPDKKLIFANPAVLCPPHWGWGFDFLADMTRYIDDDGINVTLDLKLNKEQQQSIIL